MSDGITKVKDEYLQEAEAKAKELTSDIYVELKQKITGSAISSTVGIEKYMFILKKEIKTILAVQRSFEDYNNGTLIIDDKTDGAGDETEDWDKIIKESERKKRATIESNLDNSNNVYFKYAFLGGSGEAYLALLRELENSTNQHIIEHFGNSLSKISIAIPENVTRMLNKEQGYIFKIIDFFRGEKLLQTEEDIDLALLYAKLKISKERYEQQKKDLEEIKGNKKLEKLRNLRLQINSILLIDLEVEDTTTQRKIGDDSTKQDLNVEEIEWDDVIGQEKAKKALRDSVVRFLATYDHTTQKSIFENVLKTEPPKAILLYGPPGTGKTFSIKAAITQAERIRQDLIKRGVIQAPKAINKRIHFSIVTTDQIKDKYIGESGKAIKKVFERAKKEAPALIVIDEIDALFTKRGEHGFNEGEREILNVIFQELDGIKQSKGYIAIGVTNMAASLDKALKSRFDKKIEFTMPQNPKEVSDLFRVYLKNMVENKIIPKFSAKDWMLLGKTGHDLKFTGRLVKQFTRSLESERNDILTKLYKGNEQIVNVYYVNHKKMLERLNQVCKKFTIKYICQKMTEFATGVQHAEGFQGLD